MAAADTSVFAGPDENWVRNSVREQSWEYADADTQYLTHNIHRYSGKFIPQIAARAVALLTRPEELVLDPYCGSGTTLVEAVLQGRRAIGIDLSPLAVLIAQTKVTPVSAQALADLSRELRQQLAWLETERSLPLFRSTIAEAGAGATIRSDPRFADQWFCKWFQPDILHDLLAIEHAIRRVKDARLQNVALVAFSDILRKSSNAHSGYPNVMFDKNAPERTRPMKAFFKGLEQVCKRVTSLGATRLHWEGVRVEHGRATALPLGECTVDAIVSHPPYVGSIPYAEYGLLSLKWLGSDPKLLDRELTGGKRQSSDVVARFREDYGKMMLDAARVLRPGRYAFFMVGNPIVRGQSVDLAAMTISLAKYAGLVLVVRAGRKGVNRRANKMGEEHLMFFRKPLRNNGAEGPTVRPTAAQVLQIGSRQ